MRLQGGRSARLGSDSHQRPSFALAVTLAAFVLAACSSEVTPTPTALRSPQPSSVPSAALVVSPTPTAAVTSVPASPIASPVMTPSPIPTLSGQYVGVLGWFSGCATLDSASRLYEIYFPSDYRVVHPSGTTLGIVDPSGNVVARDGDWVGIDAEPLTGGGSSCQLGHKLAINQIVSVIPGTPSAQIDNWSVSCGVTNPLDCQSITEAFINSFAGWGGLTVVAGTGRQLAIETLAQCGLDLPSWAAGRKCWQASAPWPSSQSWQPKLPGRICEVLAQGDGTDGITGIQQFAGDYLGGASFGPDWPPCDS